MASSLAFTVFTATYNRAHTLHRVYDSLCAQSFDDFEWLVVDDGSTDGTADLVAAWRAEAPFAVRYLRQANGGQHRACNRGLQHARGELFAMVDSDDACPPDALAYLWDLWRSVPAARRGEIAGVGGLCSDEFGRLVGQRFPRDPYDASALEMHFRDHIRGQKWWCPETAVLRQHPWLDTPYKAPNPWFSIARRYRFRMGNHVVKIYYQDDPENSLVRAAGSLRAAMLRHRHELILNDHCRWWAYDPLAFLRSATQFARCSLHVGQSWRDQHARLTPPIARALWLLAAPAGWLVYQRDRRRGLRIKL
ncbi:MAG: glycosyltransferase family 2 protein [Rubrivivax sp.]|nr:glycosyltransferase family 2 protein [Rubrivivax sp.]